MASTSGPKGTTVLPSRQGLAESSPAKTSTSLTQTNVLMASATFPLVASAGSGPIYAEGEEVRWVRVASALGGPSTGTYITASGRELPATALTSRVQ